MTSTRADNPPGLLSRRELGRSAHVFLDLALRRGITSLTNISDDFRRIGERKSADPAAWRDWIESTWITKGYTFDTPIVDDDVELYTRDGLRVIACISENKNTIYRSEEICIPAHVESDLVSPLLTEVASMVLFKAFIDWPGWADDWQVIDAMRELDALSTSSASDEIHDLWAQFFG